MKIAIVAPVYGATGGPELSTLQLADSLVDLGIEVTVFAPKNFSTRANLHPTLPQDLWSMPDFLEQTVQERSNLIIASQIEVLLYQDQFDLIHISSQRYAYSIAKHLHIPVILTLHNQMKERDIALIKKIGVKTIALTKQYQKKVGATTFIYPSAPLHQITPSLKPGKGLIAIGRITSQKGIHQAIAIARGAKKPLTIVGRTANSEERQAYYQNEILPFIDGDNIRHIEEIPYQEVLKLLRQSEALLFPIVRPETFGRVSIESLACGTPVIGSLMDPLPEVLHNSKVAFLSSSLDELTAAAIHTEKFDRQECRSYAEKNFSPEQAAKNHLKFYETVLQTSK